MVLIDRTQNQEKVFSLLQYMSNVDSWCKACGEVELPSELQDLEDAIHHHQGIYEHITLAYSEVSVSFVSWVVENGVILSLDHEGTLLVA